MNKVEQILEKFNTRFSHPDGIIDTYSETLQEYLRTEINSLLEEVAVATENAPMYDVPTLIRSYKSQ